MTRSRVPPPAGGGTSEAQPRESMAARIRLTRMGRKKAPHYRIVVAHSSSPRDGRTVETLGYYKPLSNPARLVVNLERVEYWMGQGALPTETVRSLLAKARKGGDASVALGEPDLSAKKKARAEALAAERAAAAAEAKAKEEAAAAAKAAAAEKAAAKSGGKKGKTGPAGAEAPALEVASGEGAAAAPAAEGAADAPAPEAAPEAPASEAPEARAEAPAEDAAPAEGAAPAEASSEEPKAG